MKFEDVVKCVIIVRYSRWRQILCIKDEVQFCWEMSGSKLAAGYQTERPLCNGVRLGALDSC